MRPIEEQASRPIEEVKLGVNGKTLSLTTLFSNLTSGYALDRGIYIEFEFPWSWPGF